MQPRVDLTAFLNYSLNETKFYIKLYFNNALKVPYYCFPYSVECYYKISRNCKKRFFCVIDF